MNPSRIGRELVVVTVVCILTIFLFPSIQGPYSVVNGPVTALQAARYALRLQASIVHTASSLLGGNAISQLVVFSWMPLPDSEFRLTALVERDTILRC
jgi:hypothetical protein